MDKAAANPELPETSLNLNPNALIVLSKRYLAREAGKPIETPEDMFRRVARNIAAVETTYDPGMVGAELKAVEDAFYEMMANLDFLPNSPTLMNAGRDLQQLSACFVLPVEDSMDSIFEAVKNAALVHKSGGGTGFSFSRLRPKNDTVLTTGGVASGPVSFMRVFNSATAAVTQGGTRRGANMGILRVDHPDILGFITAKDDHSELTNFNISVAVSETFMRAVEADQPYDLINPRTGGPAGQLQAGEIFDLMVKQAWRNGEPGIIFIDRINRDNPTPQLGDIESTNPCGEQPLLPNEPCNLGSINVSRMVKQEAGQLVVDWDRLRTIVHRAVRFLDNVIDANRYPLPAISERAKGNRKIGLGVMGWHDLLVQVGVAYDSEEALQLGEDLMAFLDAEGKKASSELAVTRGVFPNFEGSVYDRTGGPRLRNATVTTIAPTGTLSIIAGSSSGIEPLFAICYTRTVMDKVKLVEVNPYFERIAKAQGWYSPELMETITHHNSIQEMEEIPSAVRRVFVTAHDIKPEWHIRMQAAFQRHTDNAVSKTVNFPFEATEDDVREVFLTAYREGCKGVTIYRDRSRDAQVLSVDRPAEAPAAVATRPGKIVPRKRPEVTVGQTEKLVTGCGNLYVTVNQDQEGLCEVFTQMGKCGGCAMSQLEATARLISLALRAGVEVESIVKHLRGIRCPSPGWQNGTMVLSCPDAIAIALSRHANGNAKALQAVSAELPVSAAAEQGHATAVLDPALRPMGACPDCGGVVEFDGGCTVCRACGYSRCG